MASDWARRRIDEVRRIFEEQQLASLELLDGWDGRDLAELGDFLTDEELQDLMDRLGEVSESESGG